jgi:hypothetical protein
MVKSKASFYFSHYPAERHAFLQDNSRKVKTSCLYTAEKHAFPQENLRKVKTFRELSCQKFQYTAESQNLTFERLITTSADNFRQEVNHG